ncbi:unnamed protein product [Schistosoma turkestanicum]|nr:unnamed protein product [Schistosoma turkestanicum]
MFRCCDQCIFFYGIVLFQLTIPQICAPPTISNPTYQSYSSDDNDQWQEVPEPTISIFDAVRNQTPTYPNKVTNLFGTNSAFNNKGYRVIRSADLSTLYVVPTRTAQQIYPVETELEDEELKRLINRMNGFESRSNEYPSPGQTMWTTQSYTGWSEPVRPHPMQFQQTSPPQSRFPPPAYMTSIQYQNGRNSLPPTYSNTFMIQRTNLPSPRSRFGSPVDMSQQNRFARFQLNQPSSIYNPKMLMRQPYDPFRRPIFGEYLIPNNRPLNKDNFQGYRPAATLLRSNINYPTFIRNTNPYNRTGRLLFNQ